MRTRIKIAFLLVPLTLFATKSSAGREPIDIGAYRELFVDQLMVDRMDGVRFPLRHPRPAEVAVTLDQPWESIATFCAFQVQ